MKTRLLALILAALMLLTLVGCTKTGTDTPATNAEASKGEGYTIGFSNFSLSDSWRVQMEAEFKHHAEELKANGTIKDYVMLQANGDQAKQISDIRDLITMGVDAIVVACITPDGLNSVIGETREEGIKVINFNQSCTADVDCRIVISDYDLMYDAGKWLGELMPENAKIIVLDGIEGNAINAARHNGGIDGLKAACPTAEVIATLNLAWDYATAKAAMEDILANYPQIDGILSQGGAMTQAAIDAYVEQGLPLVPMTGEASNGFLRVWLEQADNGLQSMAFCNPTWISVTALDTAIRILNGEEVEKEITVTVPPVTLETAKDLYRPDVNDSFWVHTYLSDAEIKELFPK